MSDPVLDISLVQAALEVKLEEAAIAVNIGEAQVEVVQQEAVIAVEAAGPRGPQGDPGQGAAIEVPFSYGDATPEFLTTAQAGKLVYEVGILITTPFNGAGAALKIGSTLVTDGLMSQGENNPASAGTYETHPNVSFGGPAGVYLTIIPGAGASQGAGLITLIIQQ